MNKHFKYLSYVIRHKWFVLLAGIKVGAPLWRLIIHDWSKFLPSEWFPYVEKFYGDLPAQDPRFNYEQSVKDSYNRRVQENFDRAWLLHQNRHPHHWQFWVLMEDSPEGPDRYRALPMPEHFAREMVADWMGAGRAITGKWEVNKWYANARRKQVMHPYTREFVEFILGKPQ